jgi:hypothetical protein
MPGKLDEISRAIGSIETSVRELGRRADEDRAVGDRRHRDNLKAIESVAEIAKQRDDKTTAAITGLGRKLDDHARAIATVQPAVAALELSRSKLAIWASIGFSVAVLAGWVVEAAVKWFVAWALSHFQ